ncbi:MAG: capsule assembly Wzi family protein, partial [Gemmatimonadota bacterium]|nr:capsule assembly Wzi family protein [Gemmatimonadota bacterium]
MAGLRGRYGPLSIVLAPEFLLQRNLEFQTISSQREDRSSYASPWHEGASGSLDLPLRFGRKPSFFVRPGQSSVTVEVGRLAMGAATENLWWGPGIRNAIVMSSNAPGIPHLFLRTAAPLRTPLGLVEGRWIVGTLRESAYFDFQPENDARSLGAIAISLQTAAEPNLAVGATRAVYATRTGSSLPFGSAFDVFRSVGRPNAPAAGDSGAVGGRDQLFSLFGRWVFPESGLESYVEWARFEQPASLRELLADPGHTQGYTVGLQWARPVSSSSVLRLQSEATYLEPGSPPAQQPLISSYASTAVPQG